MRRRRRRKLWARLLVLQKQTLGDNEWLMKLGAAKAAAGLCWKAVTFTLPELPLPAVPAQTKVAKTTKATKPPKKPKPAKAEPVTFTFALDRPALRQMRRREGRYLLRSNLTQSDPAALWQHYITLIQVEEAFKNLKGDLSVRPVFHQKDSRIEALIFVAFLAYCLQVTLGRRLHALAPGLPPRAVLEKFASLSMLAVHLPTTDGRTLRLTRYTQPDQETQLLLEKLKLTLPPQPPPQISGPATTA